MKRTIPKDTEYFHYYNANPKNIGVGDCVIRALSVAMRKSWEEVYDSLYEIGKKMKRMPNDKKCYQKYLEQNGWVKMKQPRKDDNTKYTGKEFCMYLSNNYASNIIAHIGCHHVVCFTNDIGGYENWNNEYKVVDTWNSTNGCIGNYYVRS